MKFFTVFAALVAVVSAERLHDQEPRRQRPASAYRRCRTRQLVLDHFCRQEEPAPRSRTQGVRQDDARRGQGCLRLHRVPGSLCFRGHEHCQRPRVATLALYDYNARPIVDLVNAATKHLKDTIQGDFRNRTAIVSVSDGWDNTDGDGRRAPGEVGLKVAKTVRDAKNLGIRVHWGRPKQTDKGKDIGELGSAVLASGGWYSELNDGGGLDYFADQVFEKGLTNKDQQCGTSGKPDPVPIPSSTEQPPPSLTEKPPPTSEAAPPTSSQAPPPASSQAPPPTSFQAPPPTSEAPPPISSAAPPPTSASTECKASSVSTVTEKVTEKVTETVTETITAPAPSATSGKVCLAP